MQLLEIKNHKENDMSLKSVPPSEKIPYDHEKAENTDNNKIPLGAVRIDVIEQKLATINMKSITKEEEPVIDCSGCGAKCCSGIVTPLLTTEEVQSHEYPLMFNGVPENIKKVNPDIEALITLYMRPGIGCAWLKDGKCTNYEKRPMTCRRWDCRTVIDPPWPKIAKERFGVCGLDKK